MSAAYIAIDRLKSDYGIHKTKAYELLNQKKLRAKKLGRKTLVETASVEEFMASQPAYGRAA